MNYPLRQPEPKTEFERYCPKCVIPVHEILFTNGFWHMYCAGCNTYERTRSYSAWDTLRRLDG